MDVKDVTFAIALAIITIPLSCKWQLFKLTLFNDKQFSLTDAILRAVLSVVILLLLRLRCFSVDVLLKALITTSTCKSDSLQLEM